MRDAFVMLAALGFGAGFSYMIYYSSVSYYTTWALVVHVMYFVAFVINSMWFGDNTAIARWGFAPGSCIAVSVAAAVVFIVASQWDDLFEEYCSDSDECYDLMLEFMITHYIPPIAYLLVYILNGTVVNVDSRKPVMHWAYHWLLLSQAALIPGNIYNSFFNINDVYGEGTKTLLILLYTIISVGWSLMWCVFYKD